jgi:hypothetical protein
MSDLLPNMRQREVLQKLMMAEWTPHQRLAPAGEGMLGNMVSASWIERRAADGPANYRITETGRQAFRLPIPLKRLPL